VLTFGVPVTLRASNLSGQLFIFHTCLSKGGFCMLVLLY